MFLYIIKNSKKIKNLFNIFNNNKNNILFLRKARLFVKSRYSRNRQWSKSIVYFGLWFNIISVIWTIYYCYRYIFIFSHLYWIAAFTVFIAALRLSKKINIKNMFVFFKNFTFLF